MRSIEEIETELADINQTDGSSAIAGNLKIIAEMLKDIRIYASRLR